MHCSRGRQRNPALLGDTAGIREILILLTPHDLPSFKRNRTRLCQGWLKKYAKSIVLSENIGFAVLRNSYIQDLMKSGMDFTESAPYRV